MLFRRWQQWLEDGGYAFALGFLYLVPQPGVFNEAKVLMRAGSKVYLRTVLYPVDTGRVKKGKDNEAGEE
jgi:hypothetical protein